MQHVECHALNQVNNNKNQEFAISSNLAQALINWCILFFVHQILADRECPEIPQPEEIGSVNMTGREFGGKVGEFDENLISIERDQPNFPSFFPLGHIYMSNRL